MSKGTKGMNTGVKDKISAKSQQIQQGDNAAMAKKIKQKNERKKESQPSIDTTPSSSSQDYLYKMSMAPRLGDSTHWFQMLPIAFFSAFIIMITRMATYERPMDQFFWSGGSNQLTDFFSYYKMIAILVCSVLVLVLLLYRIFSQSLSIRRSVFYIPMLIYVIFVSLSYFLSDYKEFALWGWNERFEGTLPLIAYMVLLFYIINTIKSERDVKWIIYPLAVSSTLLGLLGISQALDQDFLRTTIGKKLITPSWFWDRLDGLSFTFQNKEIYQTVYNINYVSFYLTLLIPLFGLLFIRSVIKNEPLLKTIMWGFLFSIQIFNLIGAASSSGLLGIAFAIIISIFVLNKKIIHWIKPIIILMILSLIVSGLTYERWVPELANAINGVLGKTYNISWDNSASDSNETSSRPMQHKIDYMITSGSSVVFSYEGEEVNFKTYPKDPTAVMVTGKGGLKLNVVPTNISPFYRLEKESLSTITLRSDQDASLNNYLIIGTDGNEWPFMITDEGLKYITGLGQSVELVKTEALGWENNQAFGSGRGYIWSRTIPMIKDTIILGHGADTYCLYFPHSDYVGKYNSGVFTPVKDIIVDKPHNMYLGIITGTGALSMLALLSLWAIYIFQSLRIYRKEIFESLYSFVGAGIFIGICGFLVAGLFNDSSVSVMPMFYGLLGTGIAINSILKNNNEKTLQEVK